MNASISSRVWVLRRTEIIASSPRPSAGRSTSARYERMTPRARSPWTRDRAVEGATPAALASALLATRALLMSIRRRVRSTASSRVRTEFGCAPSEASRIRTKDGQHASDRISTECFSDIEQCAIIGAVDSVVNRASSHLPKGPDHEGRHPPRGQEPRVPGGDHPGRRARARRNGHEVFVEADAGVGSSISNDEYVAAGATILPTADDVWGTGDLILKVKEPIEQEYHRMRDGQTLFTYLHLAAGGPAPTRCSSAGSPASPTRRSSCRTARCRCWRRCPRWPVGWPPRWAPRRCSAPTAAAAS
jgi:hypothetical protein